MDIQSQPQPAKLFVGILTTQIDLIQRSRAPLQQHFGEIDAESETFDFHWTDYYRDDMGPNLKRVFFGFDKTIEPGQITGIKITTNRLEADFSKFPGAAVRRPINLDPGYLTAAKVVLATTKDYSHRVYLADGIYAESTLHYHKGRWCHWPWTYPDYADGCYDPFFSQLRHQLAQTSPHLE